MRGMRIKEWKSERVEDMKRKRLESGEWNDRKQISGSYQQKNSGQPEKQSAW
jgi:hypothetical protein